MFCQYDMLSFSKNLYHQTIVCLYVFVNIPDFTSFLLTRTVFSVDLVSKEELNLLLEIIWKYFYAPLLGLSWHICHQFLQYFILY